MGQCLLSGWTEAQFWRSSYRAVFNLIYSRHRTQEKQRRETWEQTRFICQHIVAVSPHIKKSDKRWPIFELPWDHSDAPEPIIETEEEKQERLQAQKELFDRWDREMKEKFENGTR